jgi:predicted ABC-class ATPase
LPQTGSSQSGGGGWHSAKGGDFSIDIPGEQVLERSSCRFDDQNGELTLRMSINLPARGRSILGELAAKMLCDQLSNYVDRGLVWVKEIESEAAEWVETVEDQDALRNLVTEAGKPSDLVLN